MTIAAARYRSRNSIVTPVRNRYSPPPRRARGPSVAAAMAAIGLGVATALAVNAQALPYREVTTSHLPADLVGPCMDAAAGDIDGDGDLDLALAMEFQVNVLLLNDGRGVFTNVSENLPQTIHDSEDVAFGDFDRDGDLDLVFVSEDDGTDELYLNDGRGRFVDASERLGTHEISNALAVLDVDHDGALDILIGNIGADRVLINDGRGRFRDETARRWRQSGDSRTQDIELADVDGDGDLDIVIGNEGQNQLFINDDGALLEVTQTNLPVRSDETREIRAGDVDGDGDLDLVVANVRFGMSVSEQDYLLLNDGQGVFTTAPQTQFPEDARDDFTIQLVDVDRDGDLDAVAPSTVFPARTVEFLVLATDSSGKLRVARAPVLDTRDVDGDGDVDVIVSNGTRSHTFLNDSGRFLDADPVWSAMTGLDDIDLDDDGVPDGALGNLELGPMSAVVAGQTAGPAPLSNLQVVDLDRDGDIDVVVVIAEASAPTGDYLVLRNDGAGTFAAATTGSVLPLTANGNGFDIEIADFDRDGVQDLFLCNRASSRNPGAAGASGGQQRLLFGAPAVGTSND